MSATAEALSTVEASEKLYKLCAGLIKKNQPSSQNRFTTKLLLVSEGENLEVSQYFPVGVPEKDRRPCYQVRLEATNDRYQVLLEDNGYETNGLVGRHYERLTTAEKIMELCDQLKAAKPL